MLESTKNQLENISPYPQVRKGFRTLSRVQHKALLLQSKSKRKAEELAKTKENSSKESTKMEASASLPTPSMKSSLRLRDVPKATFLWLKFKFSKIILDIRNRPLPILKYPNRKLKRIAIAVDFNKTTLKQRMAIVRKMGNSLSKQTYGQKLGIAAPQIGINLRVIIVEGNIMFNPEWNSKETPPEPSIEACYSVPKKVFKVYRPAYGWVKWTSITGKPKENRVKKLTAIIFQHELSHLNGECLPDYGEEINIK